MAPVSRLVTVTTAPGMAALADLILGPRWHWLFLPGRRLVSKEEQVLGSERLPSELLTSYLSPHMLLTIDCSL